jgi:transcriptional regulator with XRE-family HTH domain
MDAIAMKLAERVRRLRLEARLTQAERRGRRGHRRVRWRGSSGSFVGALRRTQSLAEETLTRLAAALGVEVTDHARPLEGRAAEGRSPSPRFLRGAPVPIRKLAVRVVRFWCVRPARGSGQASAGAPSAAAEILAAAARALRHQGDPAAPAATPRGRSALLNSGAGARRRGPEPHA